MRRPRPLCAICADREATTITDWECASGAVRPVVACRPCLEPVPDPPEPPPEHVAPSPATRRTTATRDAVLAVIAASPTPLKAADIATAVGAPCPSSGNDKSDREAWRPYDAVLACLSRAVKRGHLVAEWINPRAPVMGRRYAMPKEARHAAA